MRRCRHIFIPILKRSRTTVFEETFSWWSKKYFCTTVGGWLYMPGGWWIVDEPENGRPNTRRFPRNKIRNLSFSLLGRCPLICPGRRAQTQQPFMYNYCQYLPSSKCNAISFIEDINRITVIWATAVKLMGTLYCIWIWMYNCAVKVEQEKENQFVILESFAKINQTMKYSKQPPIQAKFVHLVEIESFLRIPLKITQTKENRLLKE